MPRELASSLLDDFSRSHGLSHRDRTDILSRFLSHHKYNGAAFCQYGELMEIVEQQFDVGLFEDWLHGEADRMDKAEAAEKPAPKIAAKVESPAQPGPEEKRLLLMAKAGVTMPNKLSAKQHEDLQRYLNVLLIKAATQLEDDACDQAVSAIMKVKELARAEDSDVTYVDEKGWVIATITRHCGLYKMAVVCYDGNIHAGSSPDFSKMDSDVRSLRDDARPSR